MKKYLRLMSQMFAALAIFTVAAHALTDDGKLSTGKLGVTANGLQVFVVGSEPELSNAFYLRNATGALNGFSHFAVIVDTKNWVLVNAERNNPNPSPRSGWDFGVGNGSYYGVKIGTRTSAQLGTDVPGQVGELVFNATTGRACVSTGTAAGQFAAIGSTSQVVNNQGNQSPCYGLAQ